MLTESLGAESPTHLSSGSINFHSADIAATTHNIWPVNILLSPVEVECNSILKIACQKIHSSSINSDISQVVTIWNEKNRQDG